MLSASNLEANGFMVKQLSTGSLHCLDDFLSTQKDSADLPNKQD